ncbi:hypothetical protein ACFV16_34705 [Streptomyces massasporeus]|uniref:hypothetical protein n=1 Tax=Streptomyces massasporeus TaxID=67324 RepID=UPI0036B9EA8A
MRNFKSASRRRRSIAMLTLLGSSVPAVLPAGSAHAADAFTSPTHCVSKSVTRVEQACFSTFTQAVDFATNGEITYAPAAPPAYGSSTWNDLIYNMTLNNRYLSAIFFSDFQAKGNGTLILERGNCQAKNNPESPIAGDLGGAFLNTRFNGIFDNHINSGVGLNNCRISFYEHPNYTGRYTLPAPAGSLETSRLADQVTSVRVWNPNV